MRKIINKFSHLLLASTLVFSQGLRAQTTETTYYIPDALGSPIAAMDEAGNIKWRKHYQPYGQEIEQGAASQDNRIGYTGHVHDRASGLTYMGARYYDPEIGRFLSMDPAAARSEEPRTFNRYAYANNNPYLYVDPDGRDTLIIFGQGIPSNPFGHSALAFTGKGVYSYGTKERFGSSTTDYLTNQSSYRGQIVITLKTTKKQEDAMISAMNKVAGTKYDMLSNNCSTSNINALKKGGIEDKSIISGPDMLPMTVRDAGWSQAGVQSQYIPKGEKIPSELSQFDPVKESNK